MPSPPPITSKSLMESRVFNIQIDQRCVMQRWDLVFRLSGGLPGVHGVFCACKYHSESMIKSYLSGLTPLSA